jgi:NHLM bacteriocin system secretion protein
MPGPGKMFREEALERLSSPERLDQLMNVVSPRAWLPLASLGSLVAIAALWSVFGRLPLTVTGQGVLLYPRSVVQFQAPGDGAVVQLNVTSGDQVKKGQVIGTISQSSLEKQLQQERNKLSQLLAQAQDSDRLQQQRLALERQNLAKQRASIEASLRRDTIVPLLRQKNLDLLAQNRVAIEKRLNTNQGILPKLQQKNLTAIEEKRKSLEKRLEEIRNLLPKLKEQVEARRRLLNAQLITADAMLGTEREYFDSLARLSELEAQQKELDLQETNAERQYLENLNQLNELTVKLQEISVQEIDLQRQYLQSLNSVDELKTKLEDINTQQAKVAQESLETTINRTNNIQEVRRRIAQLEAEIEQKSQIISDYNGKILEIAAVPGQLVAAGTRLGSLDAEASGSKLMSLIYFADKDGKQIKPGMEVQVTPSLVKRERYGGIVGKVTRVSPFPVTLQDMSTTIGNQNLAETLAERLGQSGGKAPVQVLAALETDPNTISGYKWSSSNGPPLQLSSGTTAQVRVKVGEVAPISYVIPIFRSLTGIY